MARLLRRWFGDVPNKVIEEYSDGSVQLKDCRDNRGEKQEVNKR